MLPLSEKKETLIKGGVYGANHYAGQLHGGKPVPRGHPSLNGNWVQGGKRWDRWQIFEGKKSTRRDNYSLSRNFYDGTVNPCSKPRRCTVCRRRYYITI